MIARKFISQDFHAEDGPDEWQGDEDDTISEPDNAGTLEIVLNQP